MGVIADLRAAWLATYAAAFTNWLHRCAHGVPGVDGQPFDARRVADARAREAADLAVEMLRACPPKIEGSDER